MDVQTYEHAQGGYEGEDLAAAPKGEEETGEETHCIGRSELRWRLMRRWVYSVCSQELFRDICAISFGGAG